MSRGLELELARIIRESAIVFRFDTHRAIGLADGIEELRRLYANLTSDIEFRVGQNAPCNV
jgi:hypothetical protein